MIRQMRGKDIDPSVADALLRVLQSKREGEEEAAGT